MNFRLQAYRDTLQTADDAELRIWGSVRVAMAVLRTAQTVSVWGKVDMPSVAAPVSHKGKSWEGGESGYFGSCLESDRCFLMIVWNGSSLQEV